MYKFAARNPFFNLYYSKQTVFAIFSILGLNVSGCSFIGAELNNRGGFVDQKLDERWLAADTKQMRVLRAYVLIGSTLRMAQTNYATERTLIVAHANAAIKIISDAHACAYSQPGRCVYFDERMTEAEVAVIRLMISVITKKDDSDLMGAISEQFSESMPWLKAVNSFSNLLDAASEAGQLVVDTPKLIKGILKSGQFAYLTGRRIGALYRDSIELYMVAAISSLDAMCSISTGQYFSYNADYGAKNGESYSTRYKRVSPSNNRQWAIDNFYGAQNEMPDGTCESASEGRRLWARGAGDLVEWKSFLDRTTAAYSKHLIPDSGAFIQASDLVLRACEYVTSDHGEISQCIGRVGTTDCYSPFLTGDEADGLAKDGKCLLIDYSSLVAERHDRRRSRSTARMDWLSDLSPSPSHPEEYWR